MMTRLEKFHMYQQKIVELKQAVEHDTFFIDQLNAASATKEALNKAALSVGDLIYFEDLRTD